MAPQTETKTGTGFQAGVKDYRLTYYTPDYQVKDTDVLAAFRMTPQPGFREEHPGKSYSMLLEYEGLLNGEHEVP